jgi:hypothetical protein
VQRLLVGKLQKLAQMQALAVRRAQEVAGAELVGREIAFKLERGDAHGDEA